MSGRYLLRRIGVASAFRVGAVLGGVLSGIVLVPLGLLMALGVVNADDSSVVAAGAAFGLAVMFCGPLVYAVVYGLLMALNALVYNLIARLTGGLEVHLVSSWTRGNESPLPTVEQILGEAEGSGSTW